MCVSCNIGAVITSNVLCFCYR